MFFFLARRRSSFTIDFSISSEITFHGHAKLKEKKKKWLNDVISYDISY